jgi:hypothetical protein
MSRIPAAARILCLVCLIILGRAASAAAQQTLSSEEKLEQDFTDPLTTLPQLIVRDSYTPANYGSNLQTNQLIVRPIIPRIPPNTPPQNTRDRTVDGLPAIRAYLSADHGELRLDHGIPRVQAVVN